jgi:hypothetical protein
MPKMAFKEIQNISLSNSENLLTKTRRRFTHG